MAKRYRVGIDVRMIAHSGIGTYLRHLLGELKTLRPEGVEMVLFGDPGKLADYKGVFEVRPFLSPIYSAAEQFEGMKLASSVDLWHSPHYNIPLFCARPLVVTVHDLIPFVFAGPFFSPLQKFYFTVFMKRVASRARRIIAVSQNTGQDIMRHFGVPEKRIRTIHEGVSGDFRPVKENALLGDVRQRYGVSTGQKYLLYVGLIKPHKNLGVLINAVRRLRREGKLEEKLMIVGAKSKTYPGGFEDLAGIRTDDDILYVPRAEYADLPALYSMASAFVLPSLYEGFGLPVLEAFACGTPVIVSDRASLPEVAGDAALRFEADSESSLAAALTRLSGDSVLRTQLIEKGLRRASEFSWNRMARETLSVYEEVLNGL